MKANVKKIFTQLALLTGLIVNAQATDVALESAPEPSLLLNDYKVYGAKSFNLRRYQEIASAFKSSNFYRAIGWGEDNKLLLIATGGTTKGDVFSLNVESDKLKKLTSIDREAVRASVSPDGKTVALIYLANNQHTLGVLNVASGRLSEYPISHRRFSSLVWKGDSSQLGFYSIIKVLKEDAAGQKEVRQKTLHMYDVKAQSYDKFIVKKRIHFTSFCKAEPCLYVQHRKANGDYYYKRYYYKKDEYVDTRWDQSSTEIVDYLIPLGREDSYAFAVRKPNEHYTLVIDDKGKRHSYCDETSGNFVAFDYNAIANRLTAIVDNKGRASIIYLDLDSRECKSISNSNWSGYNSVYTSLDGKSVVYNLSGPGYSNNIYIHDISSGTTQLVKASEVLGDKADIKISTHAFEYPTFDNDESGKVRRIPAYWMEDKSRVSNQKPVFIFFHGGPPSQYTPRFRYSTYSVIKRYNAIFIAPNIRGSYGYGKAYMNMDNKEKRVDSIKDADYLVKYMLKQEGVDKSKIFLIGSSYGTIPAYWAAFNNKKHIAGIVDLAGIKDLTLLHEHKEYDNSRFFQTEYGDRHDPDLKAVLKQVSPYYYAAGLKMPVLISHNDNDISVPFKDSLKFFKLINQSNDNTLLLSSSGGGHFFYGEGNMYKYFTYYFDWLDEIIFKNTTYN